MAHLDPLQSGPDGLAGSSPLVTVIPVVVLSSYEDTTRKVAEVEEMSLFSHLYSQFQSVLIHV